MASWWRWSHFGYGSFDLAFYLQALDNFSHGRNWSSLLGIPPFGNHADFIILLIWPFYALSRHPMVPVIVQNLALAACFPLGWSIARQAGWGRVASFWLATALLATPALTFVALHEFHPEAFAAPVWLAIYWSWQTRRLRLFWICALLFLSCKENLALVLFVWCGVQAVLDRKSGRNVWLWYLIPGIVSMAWLVIYAKWLSPLWNGGNVDFGSLYAHLREQGIIQGSWNVLRQSIRGNLLWASLLPLLALPLLRPFTLLPAVPILLQHLLSWRVSEWNIYFHYAAPLVPIFWIAGLEAMGTVRDRLPRLQKWGPPLMAVSSLMWFVGTGALDHLLQPSPVPPSFVNEKKALIAGVAPAASVMAPIPMLSHLSARRDLYSLHLLLKGLKTLSRAPYQAPPPTDEVILDYSDEITLDPLSGYYHPAMRMNGGQDIPSSDVLLHRWLAQANWQVVASGPLTHWIIRQAALPPITFTKPPLQSGLLDQNTDLLSIRAERREGRWYVASLWRFRGERKVIPWMTLVATQKSTGERRYFTRGLCCPEARADGQVWEDNWSPCLELPDDWDLQAVFEDHPAVMYARKMNQPTANSPPPFVAHVGWEK